MQLSGLTVPSTQRQGPTIAAASRHPFRACQPRGRLTSSTTLTRSRSPRRQALPGAQAAGGVLESHRDQVALSRFDHAASGARRAHECALGHHRRTTRPRFRRGGARCRHRELVNCLRDCRTSLDSAATSVSPKTMIDGPATHVSRRGGLLNRVRSVLAFQFGLQTTAVYRGRTRDKRIGWCATRMLNSRVFATTNAVRTVAHTQAPT